MREVEVPSAAPGTDATFEVPVEFQDGKIVIDVRAAEEQANAIPGQVNTIRESGRLPGGNDAATSLFDGRASSARESSRGHPLHKLRQLSANTLAYCPRSFVVVQPQALDV